MRIARTSITHNPYSAGWHHRRLRALKHTSMTAMNNNALTGSPCLTPLERLNLRESTPAETMAVWFRCSFTWVEYMRRATHDAERHFHQQGYTDWVAEQEARKEKFSAKLASGSSEKWSAGIINWEPWFRVDPWRRVGRPCLRWSDSLMP